MDAVKNDTPFTPRKISEIVELYSQGHSVRQIAKCSHLPTDRQIYMRMTKDANFRNRMKAAKSIRGFAFEEKAINAAEDTLGESSEEVAAQRLRVETFKWAAQVNDPEVYGTKVKHSGDAENPVAFLIDTGIHRPEAIEVKSEPAPGADSTPQPSGDSL